MPWWLWVLIVVGGLVALLAVNVLVGRRRTIFQFGMAAERPIGELEEGTVARVRGTVVAVGEPLTGPATGRPVVAYRLSCRWVRSDEEASPEVLVDEQAVDFVLEDATGRVHVRGEGLTLLLEDEPEQPFDVASAPDWVAELATRAGVTERDGRYHVHELALEPGETAGALGVVVAGEAADQLELTAAAEQGLVVTDRPAMLVSPGDEPGRP